MRISSKCSMALHALLLLAVFPAKKITSEDIARSIGCNPVMIRNLFVKLREAGIITTQRGTGGSSLAKEPKDISVWTVYQAVDRDSLENLIGLHPNPHSACPVGKQIYALLDQPYGRVKDAMRREMEASTLQQLVDSFSQTEFEKAGSAGLG